jgi:hypothetical protein
VYKFKDGTKLRGEFKNDIPDGWCEIIFSHGYINTYIGEVKGRVFQGIGQITFNNGSVYEGMLVNSRLHGQGRLRFASGAEYEGGFFQGKFSGPGRMVYQNGDTYEGNFKDGLKEGFGKYISKGHSKIY